jgi:hypothetical protein
MISLPSTARLASYGGGGKGAGNGLSVTCDLSGLCTK